jgi:nitrite reductase (cytochrome c-552)
LGTESAADDQHVLPNLPSVPEAELHARVRTIQGRTEAMLERAAQAMVDMLGAMGEAKASGASPEQLAPLHNLQKKAMWRLDYISSENSMGFHADQEAVRVLGESIDFSRQAQALAVRLRAPAAPQVAPPADPEILGVDPYRQSPSGSL